MGIKVRNQDDWVVFVQIPGTQAAATARFRYRVPFDAHLVGMTGKLGTAGTTGTQVVDINKNGTTIYSGAGKLDFATTATAATYGPLTANPTLFAAGDALTFDIDTVHTTPAVGLSVELQFRRARRGTVAAMITDAVAE